jgi:hypothetical protein
MIILILKIKYLDAENAFSVSMYITPESDSNSFAANTASMWQNCVLPTPDGPTIYMGSKEEGGGEKEITRTSVIELDGIPPRRTSSKL